MSIYNPTDGKLMPQLAIPVLTMGNDTIAIQMTDGMGMNVNAKFSLLIVSDALNENIALATVTKGSVLQITAAGAAAAGTALVTTDASGAYASAAGSAMGMYVINLGLAAFGETT